MREILALRLEEAQLLGYRNFGEVSVVAKMAQSPEEVITFLRDLAQRARPYAEKDVADLRTFAAEKLNQADVSGAEQLEQEKRQLDALTASFKQMSGIVLPLGKQSVLFDLYKNNVVRWRGTVESQYSAELRKLLVRVCLFAVIVAVVLGLSEIWR